MSKKRGQVSLEYVLMVGIALMLLMPLMLIYINHQQTIKDDVNIIQSRKIVESIVDNSEKLHFIGSPAKTTLKARFPEEIQDINITNNRVIFFVRNQDTVITVYKYSDANLTGDLDPSPGMRRIVITAEDNYINISSK
ncbi:MAG: class III signal peptide-containing protein [Candidatus Nanoarchaeia archaeon]